MIYTLTLNPSLDYVLEFDHVNLGQLNRSKHEAKFPGGKGINVSQVLKGFGVESTTFGFLGGFTGDYIENYLNRLNINTDFIKIKDDTRINVKIKSTEETELNAKGPTISDVDYEALKSKVMSLTDKDVMVLSGSIPSSLPRTTYEELVKLCFEKKVKFVVDAEGDILKSILQYKPFLIKPNHHELSQLFGTKVTTIEEVIPYARELVKMGAQNVIVSLAGNGAVFVNNTSIYSATVPKGEVKSSVGAGDSMVAGFLATIEKTNSLKEAFQYSVASGSATAFSVGLCNAQQVEQLLPQVILENKSNKGD